MFICCGTKPKKSDIKVSNSSNGGNTDAVSMKITNIDDEPPKKGDSESLNRSTHTTMQKPIHPEKHILEIQNMVSKIQRYRESEKFQLSLDVEKSFLEQLIDLQLETTHFMEFGWAMAYTRFLDGKIKKVPQEIDNSKLVVEELRNETTIIIRDAKDNGLMPNLQPDQDYVLLNERSWMFIQLLYGGGPQIYVDIKEISSPEVSQVPTNTTNNELIIKRSTDPVEIPKLQVNYLSDDNEKIKNRNTAPRTNTIKIQPKNEIKFYLPIVGLENPKYYCYMNAALQCLLSINELTEKILSISKIKQRRFTFSYQELISQISNSSSGKSINPEQIQQMSLKKFKYSQQQDAHEFLFYLLTEMQEEMGGKKKQYQKEEFTSAEEAWDVYISRNQDIINNLFAGQIASKSHCGKCGKISEGFDPIWDLSLPLSKYFISRQIKLSECLMNYFQEEKVNDEWKCEKCQQQNKSVLRKIELTQTPKILMLQLKRFSQFPKNQKITDEVTYPEDLDLKEFCTPDVKNTQYKLKGLISHMGQLNGGHYVSYTQRYDQWYHFDDEIVTKVTNNKHLSDKGAYILLYQQL